MFDVLAAQSMLIVIASTYRSTEIGILDAAIKLEDPIRAQFSRDYDGRINSVTYSVACRIRRTNEEIVDGEVYVSVSDRGWHGRAVREILS